MRDAMTADNAEQTGLYFGARDGSLYASTDDGRVLVGDRPSPARRSQRPGRRDLTRRVCRCGAE